MNSAHLLTEDRHEYERILDEALRSVEGRPGRGTTGTRLNREQLRTMALNALALITGAAAAEYQDFVLLREQAREVALLGAPRRREPAAEVRPGPRADGSGRRVRRAVLGVEPRVGPADRTRTRSRNRLRRLPFWRRLLAAVLGVGAREAAPRRAAAAGRGRAAGPREEAGVAAVVGVLALAFTGATAAVCLVFGYVLKGLGLAPSTAQSMVGAGWVVGAIAAAAALVALVGLLVGAARWGVPHRRGAARTGQDRGRGLDDDVARAREAWRTALLERGFLPFLEEALADPPAPGTRRPYPHYSAPDFTRPDVPRPDLVRPDFTSPDFPGAGSSDPRSD
ncbi:hypothetical protein [Streptomyces sp. NPDC059063]|uniref:hypothetical protein n=1 Tax=unclassified Streptomyces TaxID=2593676 RepID=UPI0036742365